MSEWILFVCIYCATVFSFRLILFPDMLFLPKHRLATNVSSSVASVNNLCLFIHSFLSSLLVVFYLVMFFACNSVWSRDGAVWSPDLLTSDQLPQTADQLCLCWTPSWWNMPGRSTNDPRRPSAATSTLCVASHVVVQSLSRGRHSHDPARSSLTQSPSWVDFSLTALQPVHCVSEKNIHFLIGSNFVIFYQFCYFLSLKVWRL